MRLFPRRSVEKVNFEICNCCGKKLGIFDRQQNFNIHKYLIGYGSAHDGYGVHLQLCCDCFDKLVEQCKVNPIIE